MNLSERVAVIVEIARSKKSGRLGKTAVMKTLHLLQEAYGVPLGYRFSLYTYGPYDSAVMSDIDYAEASDALSVSFDEKSGYTITPGKKASQFKAPSSTRKLVAELMREFGSMSARDLELRSTIYFLGTETKRAEEIVSLVRQIKPKYSETQIRAAIDEFRQLKLLQIVGPALPPQ
jgi:uncharacterized protein YwgA